MRFVETPVFTRRIHGTLSDEQYRALQMALVRRPEQGSLIPGSGGLRKIRWGTRSGGNRGGYRIIYYWERRTEIFYIRGLSKQPLLQPRYKNFLHRLRQLT